MWIPNFEPPNENFQKGFEEGFDYATDLIKKELKKAHKDSKKQQLLFTKVLKKIKIKNESMFTCTATSSNHSCNCEYCELDEKENV